MKIADITNYLESLSPLAYQESYDNAGLIVGSKSTECTGVLVCLDSIESTLEEAIEQGCNLIVAHHPIIFSGLKRITDQTYIERVVTKAIKNDIAIYAIHTNLDNVHDGVNHMICNRIGLTNQRTLAPKSGVLQKLVVFCPHAQAEEVRSAIFEAGAGVIGDYDQCSFNLSGDGTFRGGEGTDPFVGNKGERHQEAETRIETILPKQISGKVVKAMIQAHPYEEVAYDLYPLSNEHPRVGSGMIGELEAPLSSEAWLEHLKNTMDLKCIRYTEPLNRPISKVAVCGGSGSFLLGKAMASGADVFVTADYKYHDFFDADGQIMICDVGHYESERFTIELLAAWLKEKFPKFAVRLTEVDTNPINYYY